ncbi:MAG: precorrin-8X/cobalt-precorrin-8 methylmutase [Clostridia bacterium]|jgi:precorrin-8X/cobalt-precorrin-8 methylmutase|nr:precorrin-8X/cobalt-precorrin-8 methylmutase [Clostridia bacterium]MDN5323938.1 precorrin-8X/cobalt-precorrin-8 methylmutase [Clostridia bacterium]
MIYQINPKEIEEKSMKIISDLLGSHDWPPLKKAIIHRIVHTSGDPDYANWIEIHPQAIEAGINALKAGCQIITDVQMVATGINKNALNKLGVESKCFLNEPEVREVAQKTGETRSMTAFKLAEKKLDGNIIAIGNAPTALFTLLELCKTKKIKPALIIGTPVGFVGAKESKELLMAEAPVPFITVRGTKGGSPIAAAIINALTYSLVERND